MATIKERKDQDGTFSSHHKAKRSTNPDSTFGRIADAKKWIQQIESPMDIL